MQVCGECGTIISSKSARSRSFACPHRRTCANDRLACVFRYCRNCRQELLEASCEPLCWRSGRARRTRDTSPAPDRSAAAIASAIAAVSRAFAGKTVPVKAREPEPEEYAPAPAPAPEGEGEGEAEDAWAPSYGARPHWRR